ncbi:L-carnitine dehydratase/bile acid-inducible protein F [Oscillochloris trichoides DG-6]|uniref:L-carnitine dehydratase/bile acid-inducible protein F n=1 Tax=Oscillochloris trichoides DG-6 TaxID=765420 RepID=E1ID40_9CHLR|nr:CoA transferase [Oscillochloris trichoides]EFO80911.1 L-carnitine dehydratase/bile acid-inducible protein F [Oscillochloris trichoides DG-6]
MLAQALTGIHVIEVAAYIPGPACTQILVGMGARVTKVERPGGDPMRVMPPLDAGGESPQFRVLNRGKEHLALDLKLAEDVARLRELAQTADVLVDGFRPGVLERLGLGAATLCAANPRLIYCAISGFGAAPGDSLLAGHDLNFVARSGFLAMTGVAGEPAMPGAQLADLTSGLMAATAILGALQARQRTGRGGVVDVPMDAAMRWLMEPWYAVEQAGVPVRHEHGHILAGELACYRIYRTADGRHLAVAALEAHFWERLCGAIGRPDLAAHQHDADQVALGAAVAAAIVERPLEDWARIFTQVDACVSPVRTVAEAAAEGVAHLELPVR